MVTLALYSNKGGVGKTAAAVNLAYLAAQSGKSTLLCDLDPQSAATYYLRIKPKLKRRARGFSKAGKPVEASIKGTKYENFDLLPADFTHRNSAEMKIYSNTAYTQNTSFGWYRAANRRVTLHIGLWGQRVVSVCSGSLVYRREASQQ
jgi:cellulose biosynthesis protein BcsQ